MAGEVKGQVMTTCCPLWNEEDGSCRYSQGGLLIPVLDHIQTYCLTENHVSCSYFVEARQANAHELYGGSNNRRRFPRIPGSTVLRISEYVEGACSARLFDAAAATVDLCPLGIRVESHRALPVDEQICFQSVGDSGQAIEGVGRVVWCRSMEDAPVYQAGLCINDPLLADLLRRRSPTLHP
jgi:hypothetical protein